MLNKFGGWLTVICVVVGFILKLRNDLVYKTVRTIGKSKMMDLLLMLNEMTQDMSLDDIAKFISDFKHEYVVKMDMKGAVIDLNVLLTANKMLKEPSVDAVLQEYRKKKEYGVLKNKKRWREVRFNPGIDKALDAILNTMLERYNLQAAAARKKASLDQVAALINCIKSDEKLMVNRETRKKIEAYTDELRSQEKEVDLKKVQERLFSIFKGVSKCQ